MHFIVLVHEDLDSYDRLPAATKAALAEENLAYDRGLRQSGKVVASGPLAAPQTATIVRGGGDGLSMTDGPYVETKEHLAGFFLMEAANQAEAVKLASGFPMVRHGAVLEVREHWSLEEELGQKER
jgi:hypothetical protein